MRSGKLGLLLFMRPFQGVSDLILGLIFFFLIKKKSRTGTVMGLMLWLAWLLLGNICFFGACNKKYDSGHTFVSNPILESHLGSFESVHYK